MVFIIPKYNDIAVFKKITIGVEKLHGKKNCKSSDNVTRVGGWVPHSLQLLRVKGGGGL